MAAKGIPLHKVPHFATTLASAALEWLLIFLLFIHAIFSYSITKFACYCSLQVPCLLCSRLDHILGCEKLGFYWDLICRHHQLEISSLVVCHVHNKLVDVHSMCENCLFSFATINKSNAETYRLLVGKLGEDSPSDLDEDSFEDHKHGNCSKRICSCCNQPCILRNHAQNLLQIHSDFDDLNHRNERTQELEGYDPLSHVQYSKVKNFSDTESEVPFSDDDDGIALLRESSERKRDFVKQSVPMLHHTVTAYDDLISEKLIHSDSTPVISLLDLQGQVSNNVHEGDNHVSSNIAIGHGLEEISWLHVKQQVDISHKTTDSKFTKVPQACDAIVTQVEESKVCVDSTETVELEQISSKQATYDEIKTVIERETSVEVSYIENDMVTNPVQLEQKLSDEVTVEETKPAIEREASSDIKAVVIDKVIETDEAAQTSIEKIACEKNKNVVEREAGSEIPLVVNNKITETCELEETISEKVSLEEVKPVTETVMQTSCEKVAPEEAKLVIEREPGLEVPYVINDKITGKLEQPISQKVTREETKPALESGESEQIICGKVTHEETQADVKRGPTSEISSVVYDKITETGELEQPISHMFIHEETKPAMESGESEQISCGKVTREEMQVDVERGSSSDKPSVVNDSVTPLPDNLELGEAYKLAVGISRRQLSGKLLEQRSTKESSRITEDLKLLLSQISASRGIDLPFNEISPRLSGNADEMSLQMLQQRISLERNESGLSLDGCVIGELEGESEVDRLKRQVDHDRRLMGALYKELEEERNASAIAANQAMAMITRLQEEKASLQMEALQCVRMMEEQAEYDVEALQKANDLLAEKEKEIQDLEADLEYFRSEVEDTTMLKREMESSCGMELRELAAEQSDSNHFKNSENVESNSTVDKPHAFSKDDLTYNSYSEFEDERLFVLECLRNLEKKLHLFSRDIENSQTREDKEGDLKRPNGNEEGSDCGGQCCSQVAIGDEVSKLIRRLETLEADRNGIDQSFKCNKEIEKNLEDCLSSQGSTKE